MLNDTDNDDANSSTDNKRERKPLFTWNTYEVLLDNVQMEWEDHLNKGHDECRKECLNYLNTYFPHFTLRSFYLKKESSNTEHLDSKT